MFSVIFCGLPTVIDVLQLIYLPTNSVFCLTGQSGRPAFSCYTLPTSNTIDCSFGHDHPTMRFPVFMSDQFLLHPHLFGGGGGGGGGSGGVRRGESFLPPRRRIPGEAACPHACRSGQSGTAWPPAAAAFIPLVLGPGVAVPHSAPRPQCRGTSGGSRSRGGGVPSFWGAGRGGSPTMMPQSAIAVNDALHIAHDLLGDLFSVGQSDSEAAADTAACGSGPRRHPGSPAKPSGRRWTAGVSKDRPSGCGCAAKEKSRGESSTSVPASTKAQKSSKDLSGEKKTESASPVTAERQTTGPEKLETAAAEDDSCFDKHGSEWTHPLKFPGFGPDEIHLKVKDGKVLAHARREESRGPGTCSRLSRLEMLQTVSLPENVDQRNLSGFLMPDGTLLLRARLVTELGLDSKADKVEALENKPNGVGPLEDCNAQGSENKTEESEDSENKAENIEALEDKIVRMESLDCKGDGMKALENKAEQVEALTFLTEKLQAEAPDSQHDRAIPEPVFDVDEHDEIPAEGRVVESLPAEAAHIPELPVNPLKELAGETLGEESLESAAEAEDKTDARKTAPEVLEPNNAEDQEEDATKESKADPEEVSHPIIQEPEEEGVRSDEEEDVERTYVTLLSTSTGDGDFEVINDGFIDVSTVIDDDTELPADKHEADGTAVTEEQSKNPTATEKGRSPDETDATRPIKRSSGVQGTPDNNNPGNVEHVQNTGDAHSTHSKDTGSTSDAEHPAESVHDRPARPGDQGAFHASLPLVGFCPGDIHVKLQGHALSITAKRQAWLAGASYTEDVKRRVDLPAHLDTTTVRCVYEDSGRLVITARSRGDHRQVPVEVVSQ